MHFQKQNINLDNFIYKKNITIAEKISQLKNKKYYLRKNYDKYKGSNGSLESNNSISSNINDISNSDNNGNIKIFF